MTVKEAINILDPKTTKEALSGYTKEDAIAVVEKACRLVCEEFQSRIQKKPIFGDDVDSWFCPRCGHDLMLYKQNACDECGQLLKWGDAE